MNNQNVNHLTEEQLADAACGVLTQQISEHISSCELCSKEVSELQQIANTIKNLEDEDVPSSVERHIFHSAHRNRPLVLKLLENPMLSIIIAVIVIFLLYLMIGMLLVE